MEPELSKSPGENEMSQDRGTGGELSKLTMPKHLRAVMLGIGGGLLIAIPGLGVYRHLQTNHVKNKLHEKYGTLVAPKFTITKQDGYRETITESQDLKTLEAQKAKKLAKLEPALNTESGVAELETRVADLKKWFDQNSLDPQKVRNLNEVVRKEIMGYVLAKRELDPISPDYLSHCDQLKKAQRDLSGVGVIFDQINLDGVIGKDAVDEITFSTNTSVFSSAISSDSASTLASEFGAPEDYAGQVFIGLTGQPLPPGLDIKLEDISIPNAQGYSQSITGVVRSLDKHYAVVVSTYGHEFGHLINLQKEDYIFSNGDGNQDALHAASVREEAAAYAFEIAADRSIPNRELAEVAEIYWFLYRRSFIASYYDGKTDIHYEAVAIADAAQTVFENPADAFNHIQTSVPLDPRIFDVVEQNRIRYHALKDKGPEEIKFDEIHKRVKALEDQMKDILDRHMIGR